MSKADLIALAEPGWWLCKHSVLRRFTAGTVYEVLRYEDGRALICDNSETGVATLPICGASFEPYDPMEAHHAALRDHAQTENDDAE